MVEGYQVRGPKIQSQKLIVGSLNCRKNSTNDSGMTDWEKILQGSLGMKLKGMKGILPVYVVQDIGGFEAGL